MTNHLRTLVPIATVGLTLLALTGCQRERENAREMGRSAKETQITGANVGTMSNNTAVEKMVAARCDRENSCNNIGENKHFANRNACVDELRMKARDDLKAGDCPKGIDAKELDSCLDSIRKESCGNPLDTLGRVTACRSSNLCVK